MYVATQVNRLRFGCFPQERINNVSNNVFLCSLIMYVKSGLLNTCLTVTCMQHALLIRFPNRATGNVLYFLAIPAEMF